MAESISSGILVTGDGSELYGGPSISQGSLKLTASFGLNEIIQKKTLMEIIIGGAASHLQLDLRLAGY